MCCSLGMHGDLSEVPRCPSETVLVEGLLLSRPTAERRGNAECSHGVRSKPSCAEGYRGSWRAVSCMKRRSTLRDAASIWRRSRSAQREGAHECAASNCRSRREVLILAKFLPDSYQWQCLLALCDLSVAIIFKFASTSVTVLSFSTLSQSCPKHLGVSNDHSRLD
ncbi:hypothetical protein B0H12DRAFT_469999 [Mycena haematopus]|nr:hypothetical protein B0H12DRAFT_469999 [Mycena haematopus]